MKEAVIDHFDDQDDRPWIGVVGASLRAEIPAITAELAEIITDEVEVLREPSLRAALDASIESNVAEMLHMMRQGIRLPDLNVPRAGVEYALLLAQRQVPVTALVRAYRVPHARFTQRCIDALLAGRTAPDDMAEAAVRLTHFLLGYVDRVTEELVEVHENESRRWGTLCSASRLSLVRRVLDGDDGEARALEVDSGYRLAARHLGIVLWSDSDGDVAELERLIPAIARDLGCESAPLVVPHDGRSALGWLPVGETLVDRDQLVAAMSSRRHARAALGGVAGGLAGFRRSHRQALAAQRVAIVAGGHAGTVTDYDTVGPVALLCQDPSVLRDWAFERLGPLAVDEPGNETVRETLRTFLKCGSSYSATAMQVSRHKNTVQYRVNRAKELLPAPLEEHRMEVELALLACELLGPAVLTPPVSEAVRSFRHLGSDTTRAGLG